VRNVRGHLTEIVAEMPYLTRRIRALVRFSLSEQFQLLAPERQRNTRILRAMPEAFVTSKIGFPDFDDDVVPGSHQPTATKQEGQREIVTAAETVFDEAITVAEYIELDDDNPPDPHLVLVASGGNSSYTLRRRSTRIGRSDDNDIALDSDRVSRYHAEIVCENGEMVLVDKQSRNGVQVNGQRIKDSATLKSGDVIRIGRQEFTFVVKE